MAWTKTQFTVDSWKGNVFLLASGKVLSVTVLLCPKCGKIEFKVTGQIRKEEMWRMVHRRVRGGKFKIKYEEKTCPVELGQEIDVTIIDLAPNGDGRLNIRGYDILVPKAKPRDCVKIKITNIDEKLVIGQIIP